MVPPIYIYIYILLVPLVAQLQTTNYNKYLIKLILFNNKYWFDFNEFIANHLYTDVDIRYNA